MTERTREASGLGWTMALVVGGALGTAALFASAVSIIIYFGDPMRLESIDSVATVLRVALGLTWAGVWLELRWSLRRRDERDRRPALEIGALAAALFGLVALLIPLPSSPYLVAVTVGVVAGLAAMVPLASFAQRRRLLARVGESATVERLISGRSPQLRVARGILMVTGVALCTFAAAQPQFHEGTRMLSRRGIDIVVVLDFSKSMLARDVQPSRIDLAKRELDQFIQSLGGDRVGLVAFAGEAIAFPLTTDYEAATLFWRDLGPYDMPVGGTAIGRALNSALRLFDNDQLAADRSKVIVLMTDGEDHEGDPVEVARDAAQRGIQIHVLGIGDETPELIPLHSAEGDWSGFQRGDDGEYITTALTPENERQLRQIAEVSGGNYFRAETGGVGVENIRREIRQLRQSQLEEREVELYSEAYQYFLLFGLLAIIVGSALPRGRPWARRREDEE